MKEVSRITLPGLSMLLAFLKATLPDAAHAQERQFKDEHIENTIISENNAFNRSRSVLDVTDRQNARYAALKLFNKGLAHLHDLFQDKLIKTKYLKTILATSQGALDLNKKGGVVEIRVLGAPSVGEVVSNPIFVGYGDNPRQIYIDQLRHMKDQLETKGKYSILSDDPYPGASELWRNNKIKTMGAKSISVWISRDGTYKILGHPNTMKDRAKRAMLAMDAQAHGRITLDKQARIRNIERIYRELRDRYKDNPEILAAIEKLKENQQQVDKKLAELNTTLKTHMKRSRQMQVWRDIGLILELGGGAGQWISENIDLSDNKTAEETNMSPENEQASIGQIKNKIRKQIQVESQNLDKLKSLYDNAEDKIKKKSLKNPDGSIVKSEMENEPVILSPKP